MSIRITAGGYKDPLSSTKAVKNREAVPQHGHQSQKVIPVKGRAASQQMQDQPPDHHRKNALQKVAQRYKYRRPLSQGPEDIGHSGVSASKVPDVFFRKQLGDDDGEVDAADEVSDHSCQQQRQNLKEDFHCARLSV